jgi:hypothetical protein
LQSQEQDLQETLEKFPQKAVACLLMLVPILIETNRLSRIQIRILFFQLNTSKSAIKSADHNNLVKKERKLVTSN